jgi:hypothetical protein
MPFFLPARHGVKEYLLLYELHEGVSRRSRLTVSSLPNLFAWSFLLHPTALSLLVRFIEHIPVFKKKGSLVGAVLELLIELIITFLWRK